MKPFGDHYYFTAIIVGPTKIMNRANKKWEHLEKTKYFELMFSKHFTNKSRCPSLIFFFKILLLFNTEKLQSLKRLFIKMCRFDDDMILGKNYDFHKMHTVKLQALTPVAN